MTVTIDHSVAPWTQRESTILSMVVARCWRDADYRAAVESDPRGVLTAEGLDLSADLELQVVDSSDRIDPAAGELVRYVVIPVRPADLDPASPEYDLVRRAAVSGRGILDPQGWLWGPTNVAAQAEAAVQVAAVAVGVAVLT